MTTPRTWAVDLGGILLAGLLGAVVLIAELASGPRPEDAYLVITVTGLLVACVSLGARRRFPATVAVITLAVSAVAPAAVIAAGVGLYTVAAYRRFPLAAALGLLALPVAAVRIGLHPASALLPTPGWLLVNLLAVVAVLSSGGFARTRRLLVDSLAERARRAEAEQALRAERVRRVERERIAREMHDVLAHRLSLLSLQAGAMEYGAADKPALAESARVMQAGAHQALEDLRGVITVLRDDEETALVHGLADVPVLVEESRRAGADVVLDDRLTGTEGIPDRVGHTVHAIVREALTNARKHAPEETVTVVIDGREGDAVTVEVRNGLPGADTPSRIPGSGTGLIGLTERAALAGGELAHGARGGDFVVRGRLPWPP
ncbi:sensor histidine kinase [Phytomonospora endophytica]|uniref:histidine kinase n=1 Tax=Phytomonospora endophytica TaxID=714109 RepID=A0A841FSH2_9ACTN|nr:histidine kinase [Phytomonospora endophytica]MBB6036257.1 signal transduction histidine kinase [Phytomonospora endophytica]GIG67164.1 two-component sensor histidine kinase [Phytomonospora endophytica]